MMNNNRFSQDSGSDREFRLERIQANLAGFAVELAPPSAIVTWGATCLTNYSEAEMNFGLESNESQAATIALLGKLAFMQSEYQVAKNFGYHLYDGDMERLVGLGFDEPFPTVQSDKIKHVLRVVNEHARWVSEGVTPIFPPALMTRLQTAATEARAAITNRDEEKEDVNHASTAFKIIWRQDTKNLGKLYTWCVMVWGDDDVKLNDLGFARASQMNVGGGSGPVPAAPSGLNFSGETLSWTSVSGATSYGISLSYDGGTHWEGDFNSDTNSSVVPVAEVGKLYYRVRARNANGYGEYSGTFEHLFGLSAVDNFAYADDQFTWNPVEFANGYDIQYSLANEENRVLIFNGNATSFAHTPASGSWTYRIRASYGSIKSEWVEIAVEQV